MTYNIASNNCQVPTYLKEFPICDLTGMNYMETIAGTVPDCEDRTFIAAFTLDNNIIWSTRFGYGDGNIGYGITASSDKLFLCGKAYQNQTLCPFDDPTNLYNDYYQMTNLGDEGTISRFDISNILTYVSVNKINNDDLLKVYPNPTNDIIYVESKDNITPLEKINIFDIFGKEIGINIKHKYLNIYTISTNALPAGFYYIRVYDANGNVYNEKIIKQ
jgi:hypothetical protein